MFGYTGTYKGHRVSGKSWESGMGMPLNLPMPGELIVDYGVKSSVSELLNEDVCLTPRIALAGSRDYPNIIRKRLATKDFPPNR